MKRIEKSDINFKLDANIININNFTMKFFTTNSENYFIRRTQDNVVTVEREATIEDEDVIKNGGTTVIEYYVKLDWSELENIGEGVLNFKCTNNSTDTDFADRWYNKLVERTTDYYIATGVYITPEEAATVNEKLTYLVIGLNQEILDRISGDTELDEKISALTEATNEAIDDEFNRAVSAETELDIKIDDEIERAINAETDLNIALTTETDRAITREGELTDLLTALRQDLTDESEIRSSADTSIWNAINAEILRAVSAETSLDSKIDDYKLSNNTALANEVLRATSAETKIANDLAAEITRSSSEESRIETKLDNEVSRAIAKENEITATVASNLSTLTTAIENEETRAKGQETALNTKIEAEISRATAKEDAISGAVQNYIVNNDNALSNEIIRATSAETAISGVVSNYISSNNQALANEVSRATAEETRLNNAITAECK